MNSTPSTTPIVFFEGFEDERLAQAVITMGWDYQPNEAAAGKRAAATLGPVIRLAYHSESKSLAVAKLDVHDTEVGALNPIPQEEFPIRCSWQPGVPVIEIFISEVRGALNAVIEALFNEVLAQIIV